MLNKNRTLKGKLAISGLILTLGLSGCSFQLNKGDSKVLIETNNTYDYNLENSRIDELMGFTKEVDEEKEYLDYTYFIDNSETTVATLAHVIDEKTITSHKKIFDGKEEVSKDTFGEAIIQPIVTPKAFFLYHVENISDLVENYCDCEITGRKMITLEGETLYYFESILTFNKFAENTIDYDITEGSKMTAKALYRLSPSGQLELLYKTQDGYKADIPNILETNFNDSKELVMPLEESVLAEMNGKYSELEANKTLKEYKKY